MSYTHKKNRGCDNVTMPQISVISVSKNAPNLSVSNGKFLSECPLLTTAMIMYRFSALRIIADHQKHITTYLIKKGLWSCWKYACHRRTTPVDNMMTSSNGNIFALLALYEGNSPVTSEFSSQRPVTRSFDVFFNLRLKKRLSKQSKRSWLKRPPRSLWRHCNDTG